MGNIIRKLVLGISILMLLVGLFGLTLPNHATLERSIDVDRPAQEIWPFVNNLQNFNQWSPWSRLDPNMVYLFSGPSDGVGARVEWVSEVNGVGEGSQEIVISVVDEYVKTALRFGKGVPANAEFILEKNNSTTKIRWAFRTEFDGILGRYFGLMIDKSVGGAYEEGLQNLKVLLENP
ncbi:MAG: carbon monoxide dehydrogenase subunit G [Saprospiraceae bacterium]|jgi:carbon monoxide dehydrogenase subunit G